MRTLRKLLIIVLIMSMVMAMMLPASALSADITTQEKAQVLNKLKIISGTNGEYKLGNQVSRPEAVTFIVKLIGKGNEVETHKDQYKTTPYSDVPSTQWYAPYIGYCNTNGFLANIGTEFKPTDYITEKDFLKFVLIALGYRESIDFTSDTIYDKARELELITLNDYVSHINSDVIPTRGNVVEILYSALKASCREGGKLGQKLIDEGITSRLELMALGLVVDTTAAAIQQVKITDLDTMEIKLNEAVTGVSGIRIYSKTNENDSLTCSILSVTDDKIIVKIPSIEINKEYIVELANVLDAEGNRTGKLLKDFTGGAPEEVVSDFFRIKKIEPVNGSSLKVYFTHPITINSEICLYYTLLKDNTVILDGKQGGIKAGILNSDKTGILLTLDSNLLNKGDVYTLKIDGGMMSAYGVKLNDGLGDSMKFIARENVESKFALNQITAIDKKALRLSFNKEVNPFLAQQIFNFYLTDTDGSPIRITSTTVDINGSSVYVNLEEDMEKGKKYNLTINNLNDITKQEYITEESFSFSADYGSAEKFKLTGAHLIDNQTIEVYFNKALDITTAKAENCSIYRSGGYIIPDKVLFNADNNPKMLTLYLSNADCLTAKYTYELQFSDMKDNLGNSLDSSRLSFSGINKNREDITVSAIAPISTDAVKITFTREIAFNAPNLLPSNYTLEYAYNRIAVKKAPISVIYVDAKTLVLKFDSLEYDTSYKLKITSLMDYTDVLVKGQETVFDLKKN